MFNKEQLTAFVTRHPDSFPLQALLAHFEHFEGLHEALGGRWIHGWGSYLFEGLHYTYEPRFARKQEELYRYAMMATRALEIGVYVGHSLLLMLIANPRLHITAIDCDETYARPAVEYLNRHFQNRITFLAGDAVGVMKELPDEAFDLVHIDADHHDAAVRAQFHESVRLMRHAAICIFDDYDAVRATVDGLLEQKVLELKVLPDCPYRNCITQLTHKATLDRILRAATPYSCCSRERLAANVAAVEFVNHHRIRGSVVEIGVYRGGSMIAMMRADRVRKRLFYLYDTFAGMTPPSAVDLDYNGYPAEQLMAASEAVRCASSLPEVQRHVSAHGGVEPARVHYVVGDVLRTTVYPEAIAVLRLDTDWYDSTKFELDHFYDLVTPGGVVIVDDYGHWQGCKRAVDEFLQARPEIPPLVEIDYTGVYFQRPGLEVFYVTGLFLRHNPAFRSLQTYMQHFHHLASAKIRLGIYLDPSLKDVGRQLCLRYPNVCILGYVDVEDDFLAGADPLLPRERLETKDTKEYFCIQLMKLKLMAMAARDPQIAHQALAWVDFGIFHMFADTQRCQRALEELRLCNVSRILNPGPWRRHRSDEELFDRIQWKYCGSFLLGSRDLFEAAEQQQTRLVQQHLPRLTWEVNYWALMTCFQWYQADHNDSLLAVGSNELPRFDL